MNFTWLQRRWYEFRLGNIYTSFPQNIIIFIVTTYALFIEKFNILWFSNIFEFTLFLLMVYFPLRTTLGYLHRTRQMKHEAGMATMENPVIIEILNRVKDIEKRLEEKP